METADIVAIDLKAEETGPGLSSTLVLTGGTGFLIIIHSVADLL